MEAVILSGGKGTRLQSVIKDIPKTMADVNGTPFLETTLQWLNSFNINKVILAVGYKKEYIKKYFGNNYKNINLIYSEEEEPLGTGGAIKKALKECVDDNVIVMNGDVLARVDLNKMYEKHLSLGSVMTIAVKEMTNFDRFGVVKFNKDRITRFEEKKYVEKGFMNTGIYIMNKDIFENKIEDKSFSIENDYLSKYIDKDKISPFIFAGEFIDIGIPEDYQKIQAMI